MNEHLCPGLDGANPLHLLAACGMMSALEDAGLDVRLGWRDAGGWHPVLMVALDRPAFCQRLAECFLPPEIIQARQASDASKAGILKAEQELAAAKEAAQAALALPGKEGKAAQRNAKSAMKAATEARGNAKKTYKDAESACDEGARAALAMMHPVTAVALHLDHVEKGGLTAAQLRSLVPGRGYLHGLAATMETTTKAQGGFKTTIARSAFSFANNNSGKALLKDFAGVASFATPDRVDDALFGSARCLDAITGLGWDPASQRSYALQFADPQDLVECQTMQQALAFYGLATFPVVPAGRDRLTAGFMTISQGLSNDGDEEEPEAAGSRRRAEYFQWPLWSAALAPNTVRSVLAMAECAAEHPQHGKLARQGIVAVFRARRFSLNKRSYFSSGMPA
jgi:hypothetical protein